MSKEQKVKIVVGQEETDSQFIGKVVGKAVTAIAHRTALFRAVVLIFLAFIGFSTSHPVQDLFHSAFSTNELAIVNQKLDNLSSGLEHLTSHVDKLQEGQGKTLEAVNQLNGRVSHLEGEFDGASRKPFGMNVPSVNVNTTNIYGNN